MKHKTETIIKNPKTGDDVTFYDRDAELARMLWQNLQWSEDQRFADALQAMIDFQLMWED